MFTRNFRLSRHVRFPLVLGLVAHDGVQSFVATPRLSFKSRRSPLAHPRAAGANLRMAVEPVLTLLLSAETTLPLSDVGDQAANIIGTATDVAEYTQAQVGDSLSSVGDFVSSIGDTITSFKDQVTESTLGSVDALRSQAGELGGSLIQPFQRLGEDISNSLTGGISSLKEDALGAVEGAQTQLGQSVTEGITTPLQDGLSQAFARVLGTSPEEVVKGEEGFTRAAQETFKGLEAVATPSTLFYAENFAVLPLWLAMIVWPEKSVTKAVISSYAPFVVASFVHLWLIYEATQNPVSLQAFASGINLEGLVKGFSEETTVAVVWSHLLIQDLFVGRWMYMDGQKNGIFTKHSLALCFFFGPPGVLSHLLTRTLYSVVKPGIRDIMEPDGAQVKPSVGEDPKEIIVRAKREAAAIVDKARSEGAAQASSLLEAAETEALDILKGAEVERSALLKVKTTASSGDNGSTGDKAISPDVVDTKSVADKAPANTTSVADQKSIEEKGTTASGNIKATGGDTSREDEVMVMGDTKDINTTGATPDAKLPLDIPN